MTFAAVFDCMHDIMLYLDSCGGSGQLLMIRPRYDGAVFDSAVRHLVWEHRIRHCPPSRSNYNRGLYEVVA